MIINNNHNNYDEIILLYYLLGTLVHEVLTKEELSAHARPNKILEQDCVTRARAQ